MTDRAEPVDGLPGWRAVVHRASNGRFIAAVWSPDYDPLKKRGRMIAATGRDHPDALAAALEKARGCMDRPQQQERLH